MGESSGPLELGTRLGQSALGETFLGLRDGEVVGVVKLFTAELSADASFRAALASELTLATSLEHPSIAAVLEQGERPDGRAFVLTEHVTGTPLSRLIRAAQSESWPLSMARAVSILAPVLEALGAAHALQPVLLHRDLAPENVFVTSAGRVVVSDFGIGRARLRAGGGTSIRRSYISPEQARGLALDARSEVFGAGLLLFELVCGRLPAVGGPGEVISRIATGELDGARTVNPQLEEASAVVLARALAPRPEDRFASTQEFLSALSPWAALPQPETLAAWAGRLSQVTVAAEPPKAAAAVALVPELKTEPVAPGVDVVRVQGPTVTPAKSRKRLIFATTAFAVLFLGGQLLTRLGGAHLPGSIQEELRLLELVTVPSGASVFLDGVQQTGRTPMSLQLGHETHTLIVRKSGFQNWSRVIQNARRLEINLATGEFKDERYEGGPPKTEKPGTISAPVAAPATPALATVTATPTAIEQEVVFDVESAPVTTLLTRKHSLRLDEVSVLELPDGAVVELTAGATVYQRSGANTSAAMPRGMPYPSDPAHSQQALIKWQANYAAQAANYSNSMYRPLNLFALRRVGNGVEAFDVSRPVSFDKGGRFYFFTPTENGTDRINGVTELQVNSEPKKLEHGYLVRVDNEDCFRVRVLDPSQSYRITLARADGKGVLPPVLMSMRPATGGTLRAARVSNELLLDGSAVVSGQALLGAGTHLISGTTTVWFTLPTLEGVEVPEVKLSVEPVLKPRPTKTPPHSPPPRRHPK